MVLANVLNVKGKDLMSRVEIMYLAPGGHYLRRVCHLTAKWPIYLLNNHDKQAHIIKHNEVFAMTEPLRFDTWEQLRDAEPPSPPPTIAWRQIVCEANNMWPIRADPEADPQSHSRERRDALQEARQDAYVDSARMRGGMPWLMQAAAVTGLCIAAGGFLLMATIVLTSKYG